jgi:hypothetical protein
MASTGSTEQTHTTTREADRGRFTRDSAPATTAAATSPASGRATAALVLGILSIPAAILIAIVGIALGVIGLVLGFTARTDMRRAGAAMGRATVGIVLSAIGIVLGILNVLAFIAITSS